MHRDEPQSGDSGSIGTAGQGGTGRMEPTTSKHTSLINRGEYQHRQTEGDCRRMTVERDCRNCNQFTFNSLSNNNQHKIVRQYLLQFSLTCSSLPFRHLKRCSAIEMNEGRHASLIFTSSYGKTSVSTATILTVIMAMCNSHIQEL